MAWGCQASLVQAKTVGNTNSLSILLEDRTIVQTRLESLNGGVRNLTQEYLVLFLVPLFEYWEVATYCAGGHVWNHRAVVDRTASFELYCGWRLSNLQSQLAGCVIHSNSQHFDHQQQQVIYLCSCILHSQGMKRPSSIGEIEHAWEDQFGSCTWFYSKCKANMLFE